MDTKELHGTDALKDLIKFVILGIQKATTLDANGDNKVSLTEALTALTAIGFKIPSVAGAFPEIRAEWKDLSQAELDELVVWFAAEFDLPRVEHGKLEKLVRKIVEVIVTNYRYYNEIKAILG